jgi:hypothetical protein
MSVVHTSRLRIEKHEGPHRTALVEGFTEPIHFGIHGGIREFYRDKYGREKTLLAIYEIDDQHHTVCFDLSGKKRPRQFSSPPGRGHLLQVWKRDKK